MTVFNSICLCLVVVVVALVFETNAFTVGPPAAIDLQVVVPGNQAFIAASSASSSASNVQTLLSPSNLPSQSRLLENAGSLTVAASEPPKAVAGATVAPKPASTAAPKPTASKTAKAGINIAEINFNGNVPKTESDEYVVIQNSSKDATIDVSGYIVYPATTGTQGSTFSFPKGSTIKPNSSVKIYTNEIHKESGGYSWGSGRALWSNSGGLAVLKDDKGTKLGEFKYAPPPASKKP